MPLGQSHVVDKVVGTKGYLAPEVAAGGRYSFQSDLYSAGLVLRQLFFAAAGEGPAPPPTGQWSTRPLEPPIPAEVVASLRRPARSRFCVTVRCRCGGAVGLVCWPSLPGKHVGV